VQLDTATSKVIKGATVVFLSAGTDPELVADENRIPTIIPALIMRGTDNAIMAIRADTLEPFQYEISSHIDNAQQGSATDDNPIVSAVGLFYYQISPLHPSSNGPTVLMLSQFYNNSYLAIPPPEGISLKHLVDRMLFYWTFIPHIDVKSVDHPCLKLMDAL
jgi:hypothetical protein